MSEEKTMEVPKGYMQDARGNLVKKSNIKDIDMRRDRLVRELWARGEKVAREAQALKAAAMGGIAALVRESAEQYGVTMGGKKGNVTITSFDGTLRVMRAIADTITFTEQLEVARSLVQEYLHDILKGAHKNLRAIVNKAFELDNKGNVSVARILGLRSIDIADEKWVRAMKIIAESITVQSSKEYIRFYRRNAEGEYDHVAMNAGS